MMLMYNLKEHSSNYSKASGSLLEYYRYEPNATITDSDESFKFKAEITRRNSTVGNTKDVETAVLLKYLSNFWRMFEMPLINFEINLILTLVTKLCYYRLNRSRNIHNNRYKALRLCSDSVNSRYYKTTARIEIRIQTHN